MHYWILEGKTPRQVTLQEYAEWERANPNGRRLALTNVKCGSVSTVFLVCDHGYVPGRPVLFETMVFPHDSRVEEDGDRYTTYDEAMAGHDRFVAKYGGEVKP